MSRPITTPFRLLLLLAVVLQACAHVVKPTGGPKDATGPQIVGAIPPPRTLNFIGDEVVIYFDEFIKPGNYAKEVFLSPVPPVEPTITVKNRRMRVKFNAPLRANTTYVITFGTGIKDFNEGNKMDKAFTYAFSTGSELDTLQIKGKVTFPWEDKGEPEMKVLAYLADEIEGNDIFDLRPVYATETDKEGEFTIEYLREAAYKIYAVQDADGSYTFNNSRERIAIALNPVVDLEDSAQRDIRLELFSFIEDKIAPGVRSARWSNDRTIHLEFTESIRPRFDSISLKVTLLDSATGESRRVTSYRFGDKSTQNMLLESPFPRTKDYKLIVAQIMDTLGTFSDTTLTLFYDLMAKDDIGKFFDPPIVEPGSNAMRLYSYFPLPQDLDTSQVYITDSAGKRLPIELSADTFLVRIKPDTAGLVPNIPYTLRLDSTISVSDTQRTDTNLAFTFAFTDPLQFGSLSGEIVADSLDSTAQYVMLLLTRGKKGAKTLARIIGPGPFSFPYLLAGSYTIKLIKDDDRNGYLSPGSLDPYFLPEAVIIDPQPVKVKANWTVEDYNVFPYPPQKEKSSKLARAEGESPKGKGDDHDHEGHDHDDED
ncbi:MAG: Ig-like domain-containing protein [Bacteroidota bacterium]